MTRRCLYALASVLLLANCSPITARNARKMIVGHSLIDAKECLGVPTHEEDLSNGDHLAEWDYTKSSQLASLPLSNLAMLPLSLPMSLAGSVSINDNGNTGSGGPLSASDTATINIQAVDDAPDPV